MPLSSGTLPIKETRIGLGPPLILFGCMTANTGLAAWLRELLQPERGLCLAACTAAGFLFGFLTLYIAGGIAYAFGNLFSVRRRRVGVGISWNRVFPAVCRIGLYAGYLLAIVFMAGLWFLPVRAAAILLYPAGLWAAVPFAAAVLLRRRPNAAPESGRDLRDIE